jgi:hypothetical protein
VCDQEKLDKLLEDILGGPAENCVMKNPDHYNLVVDVRKIMRLSRDKRWRDIADPPSKMQCAHCKSQFPPEHMRKLHCADLIILLCIDCKTAVWEKPE